MNFFSFWRPDSLWKFCIFSRLCKVSFNVILSLVICRRSAIQITRHCKNLHHRHQPWYDCRSCPLLRQEPYKSTRSTKERPPHMHSCFQSHIPFRNGDGTIYRSCKSGGQLLPRLPCQRTCHNGPGHKADVVLVLKGKTRRLDRACQW